MKNTSSRNWPFWLELLCVALVGALAGTLLGLLLVACAPMADPLVMVELPAAGVEATVKSYQPFVDYLSQELDQPVEFKVVTDYAAGIEALKYGHADIIRLGPSGFVLAENEVDFIPIASIANPDGTPMTYRAQIITRPGLTTLEGATLAYVDIGSASGYLLPATYIKKSGTELGKIFFAGTHPAVIEAVRNGTVDAGATCDTRMIAAIEQGVIGSDELAVFWEGEPVIRGSIVVRADMPEDLRLEIQAAFLSTPTDIVMHCGLGNERWGDPPPSRAYDPIREVQAYLGLTE